jgi:hypothetical protein
MATSEEKEAPKPLLVRGADFRQIYVNGAIGNFTPFDYRLFFYTHEPEIPDKPQETRGFRFPQVIHVEIVMTELLAKRLRHLLDRQIKEREEQTKVSIETVR